MRSQQSVKTPVGEAADSISRAETSLQSPELIDDIVSVRQICSAPSTPNQAVQVPRPPKTGIPRLSRQAPRSRRFHTARIFVDGICDPAVARVSHSHQATNQCKANFTVSGLEGHESPSHHTETPNNSQAARIPLDHERKERRHSNFDALISEGIIVIDQISEESASHVEECICKCSNPLAACLRQCISIPDQDCVYTKLTFQLPQTQAGVSHDTVKDGREDFGQSLPQYEDTQHADESGFSQPSTDMHNGTAVFSPGQFLHLSDVQVGKNVPVTTGSPVGNSADGFRSFWLDFGNTTTSCTDLTSFGSTGISEGFDNSLTARTSSEIDIDGICIDSCNHGYSSLQNRKAPAAYRHDTVIDLVIEGHVLLEQIPETLAAKVANVICIADNVIAAAVRQHTIIRPMAQMNERVLDSNEDKVLLFDERFQGTVGYTCDGTSGITHQILTKECKPDLESQQILSTGRSVFENLRESVREKVGSFVCSEKSPSPAPFRNLEKNEENHFFDRSSPPGDVLECETLAAETEGNQIHLMKPLSTLSKSQEEVSSSDSRNVHVSVPEIQSFESTTQITSEYTIVEPHESPDPSMADNHLFALSRLEVERNQHQADISILENGHAADAVDGMISKTWRKDAKDELSVLDDAILSLILQGTKLLEQLQVPQDSAEAIIHCLRRERAALLGLVQNIVHSCQRNSPKESPLADAEMDLLPSVDGDVAVRVLQRVKTVSGPLGSAIRQILMASQREANSLMESMLPEAEYIEEPMKAIAINCIVNEDERLGHPSQDGDSSAAGNFFNTDELINAGKRMLAILPEHLVEQVICSIETGNNPLSTLLRHHLGSLDDSLHAKLSTIVAASTNLMKGALEDTPRSISDEVQRSITPVPTAIRTRLVQAPDDRVESMSLVAGGEKLLVRLADDDAKRVLYSILSRENLAAAELRQLLHPANRVEKPALQIDGDSLGEESSGFQLPKLLSSGAMLINGLQQSEAEQIWKKITVSASPIAIAIRKELIQMESAEDLDLRNLDKSDSQLQTLDDCEAGDVTSRLGIVAECSILGSCASENEDIFPFGENPFEIQQVSQDEYSIADSEDLVFDTYFFDADEADHEIQNAHVLGAEQLASPSSESMLRQESSNRIHYETTKGTEDIDVGLIDLSKSAQTIQLECHNTQEMIPFDSANFATIKPTPKSRVGHSNDDSSTKPAGIDNLNKTRIENDKATLQPANIVPDQPAQGKPKQKCSLKSEPPLSQFKIPIHVGDTKMSFKPPRRRMVSSLPPTFSPSTSVIPVLDILTQSTDSSEHTESQNWLQRIQLNKKECPLILGGTHGHFQIQPLSGLYKLSIKNSQSKEFYFGHVKEPPTPKTEPAVQRLDAFLSRLFDIIESNEYADCIQWSSEGKAFTFTDPLTFQNQVIPKKFPGTWRSQCGALLGKACDFSEILRILRGYGFKKTDAQDPDTQEYMNKHFQRGKREDLHKIRKWKERTWEFPSPAHETLNLETVHPAPSPQTRPSVITKELISEDPSTKDERLRTLVKTIPGMRGRLRMESGLFQVVQQIQIGNSAQKGSAKNAAAMMQREKFRRSSFIHCAPDAFLDKLREQGHFSERVIGIGKVPPERGMKVKLTAAGLGNKMSVSLQPRSTIVLLRGVVDDVEQDGGICKVRWRTGEEEFCCTGFSGKYYLELCSVDRQTTDAKWWCQQALLAPTWTHMSDDGIWRMNRPKSSMSNRTSRSAEKSAKELQQAVKGLNILKQAKDNAAQYFSRLRAEEMRVKDERKAKSSRKKHPQPLALATNTQHIKTTALTPTENAGFYFRSRGSLAEVVRSGEMAVLEGLLRRTFDSLEHEPSGNIALKEMIFCISRMRVGANKQLMKAVIDEHDDGDEEFSYSAFLGLMYDLLSKCKVSKTESVFGRRFAVTSESGM